MSTLKFMKKFKKLSIVLFSMLVIFACSDYGDELVKEMSDVELKSVQPISVTVPFKTDFTVWNHTDPTDRSCGEMPIFKITMKGNGTINHLGLITTTMTFCNNTSTGDYWDTDIVFVAANGDELYASIPIGQVIPNEEDNSNYYNKRFNDDMLFVGGTGRFEGAKGEAMTHAYVHLPTDDYIHKGDELWHTDFFSTGELILVKGKR